MVRRDSTVFGHGQSAVGKKRDCRQTVTNSLVAPLRRRFRAWRPMRGERLRLPGACAGRLVRRYALRGLPKLSRAQPLCIRDGRHEPSIPSSPASGSTRIRRCGFRPICSAERTGSFWSWTRRARRLPDETWSFPFSMSARRLISVRALGTIGHEQVEIRLAYALVRRTADHARAGGSAPNRQAQSVAAPDSVDRARQHAPPPRRLPRLPYPRHPPHLHPPSLGGSPPAACWTSVVSRRRRWYC